MHSTSKRIMPVLIAFLSTIAIRLLYVGIASRQATFLSPGMDAEIYRQWAETLLGGADIETAYFRAPLYPTLIAALGWITENTFWPIRLLQILLSGVAAFALSSFAEKRINLTAGWLAGLGWALYPLSVYFDGEGLITSLYTTCFLFFVLEVVRLVEHPSTRRITAATILLAILTALRANGFVYWGVLPLFIFLGTKGVWTLRKRTSFALASLIALFLLLSPVFIHNMTHGGGFSVSTQGGINLYLGNHAEADGASAIDPEFGRDWTKAQTDHRASEEAGYILSDKEVSRWYTRKAINFWKNQPSKALSLTYKKLLLILNHKETGNNRVLFPYLKATCPIIAFGSKIAFGIILIFGIMGAVFCWKHTKWSRIVTVFILIHGAFLLPFFINARYRFPVMPLLVLLSAAFITKFPHYWKNQRPSYRAVLLLCTAAFAALVWLPQPLRSATHQADWLFHKGTAAIRLERWNEAEQALKTLVNQWNYPNAHLNLGVVYLNTNRYEDAAQQFRKEFSQNESNADAANNLGVIAEHFGDDHSAIRWYEDALVMDKTHPDARTNLVHLTSRLAISFAESDDLATAAYYAEKAWKASDTPDKGYNYALILFRSGQKEVARKVTENILARFPNHQPTLQLRLSLGK